MNYSILLSDNTRNDDYVNATKLCKAFGKEWHEFKRSSDIQNYIKALKKQTGDIPVYSVSRTKGKEGTWVHPLLALRLAQWLSPEFALVVDNTFKRYLEGDVTLATEIVNRSTDKQAVDKHIELAKEQSLYLGEYHGLHDELKAHGCKGVQHAAVNKHMNTVVGVDNGKREEMTRRQRHLMTAVQALGTVSLMDSDAQGWKAVGVVKTSTEKVLTAV